MMKVEKEIIRGGNKNKDGITTMKTNEQVIRIRELEDLIDDAVDLEQCKVLKEDIQAANIDPKDKVELRKRLALVEVGIRLVGDLI